MMNKRMNEQGDQTSFLTELKKNTSISKKKTIKTYPTEIT